jgi:hypothetical protein
VDNIKQWKSIDNDIVLMGNFNKNIYTGRLARRLAQNDINMIEVCHHHTGVPIPPTFQRGSVPINEILRLEALNV